MTESNRRIFPRAEGEYAAWFQLPGQSFEQCVALDIGIDGACLRVSRELPAPEIALLALLEVIFGVLLAWLGAGEVPADSTLAGGALVLAALAANEAFKSPRALSSSR